MNKGALLLAALALTHYGPDALALLVGDASTWFYALRGGLGVMLFAFVWREAPLVALWGIVEESMTAACGVAYLFKPVNPEPFTGICDAQTGLPLYSFGLFAAAILAMAYSTIKHKGRGNE